MVTLNETIGCLASPLTYLLPFEVDKGYLSPDVGSSSINRFKLNQDGRSAWARVKSQGHKRSVLKG